MAGATKLLTSGGGGVILTPATNIAADVTVQIPSADATLLTNKTAGTVLQVVQGTSTAVTSTSSTTFVDTTLSATITPTSATSKILVCVAHGASGADFATNNGIYWNLVRNSTSIFSDGGTFAHPSTFTYIYGQGWVAYYLDSPATTSATTYKTQIKSPSATTITVDYQNTSGKIILMEIAA